MATREGTGSVPAATAVAALQRSAGERQPGNGPGRVGGDLGASFLPHGGEAFSRKAAWIVMEISG